MSKPGANGRDRVAFVTGAGGGMGYRIAADLATAGARVFAVDVKEPPAPDPEGADRSGHYWQFDITEEDRVAAALGEVFAACGRLDYVVNAAGVCWFDRDGSVADIDRGRVAAGARRQPHRGDAGLPARHPAAPAQRRRGVRARGERGRAAQRGRPDGRLPGLEGRA